jgi:hypothetical protein
MVTRHKLIGAVCITREALTKAIVGTGGSCFVDAFGIIVAKRYSGQCNNMDCGYYFNA